MAETLFSTLHAPLQMLWHTRFVITILMGTGVSWGEQNRNADGTAWMFAIQRYWGHTLTGLIWGGLMLVFGLVMYIMGRRPRRLVASRVQGTDQSLGSGGMH